MAAARPPLLNVDPNMDLAKIMEQLNQAQTTQSAGVQAFGASQDQSITGIYDQLKGDLGQGAKTVQSIYGNAAGNVGAAYDRSALGNQAAASQTQGEVGGFAQSIGMDPRALAEVQGRMAQQAATFDQRNRQSSMNRQGNLQQLGAGMAAVAQLGVQAAAQAEAQGRADLSRKIQLELQRIATSAAEAKTGFTNLKAQQAAKATMQAQTELMSIQKQLISASSRSSRSSSASGPDWLTKFQLQNEEADRRAQNAADLKAQADPNYISPENSAYLKTVGQRLGRGSQGEAATVAILQGMPIAEAQQTYKTPKGKSLNWKLIQDLVNKAP